MGCKMGGGLFVPLSCLYNRFFYYPFSFLSYTSDAYLTTLNFSSAKQDGAWRGVNSCTLLRYMKTKGIKRI